MIKEKEWNIIVNEKQYNIKIELPGIFDKMNFIINNERMQMNKEITCLKVYLLGTFIQIPIQDKEIVIVINNDIIDISVDGTFLETNRTYFIEKESRKKFIGYQYCFILSLITIVILSNLFSYALAVSAIILHYRIAIRIYLTKKEKIFRHFIVVFIHWALIIACKMLLIR